MNHNHARKATSKNAALAEEAVVATRKVAATAAAAEAVAVVEAMAVVETVAVAAVVITEIINPFNTIALKILSATKGFFYVGTLIRINIILLTQKLNQPHG